ncbi:MAG: amidohydrolase family protein [Planctomycetota bacterium]
MTSKTSFWILGVLWLSASAAWAQESIAIRGGRVITMAGPVLENGTVLIRDGKIAAVGTDVKVPVEARVIDANGKVVMPGFVEAHSSEGMTRSNETNPVVPYLSVLDTVDPMRSYFEDARRNGTTTVAVVPANRTMIGGQAAILKTGPDFVDAMILRREAGIKISFEPQGNASRMGHLAALRKELADAKKAASEKPKEGEEAPQSPTDAALEAAMKKLVQGEMPVFLYCDTAMDVAPALKLTEEYGFRPILVLGRDCYKAADQIAKAGLTVVLDPNLVFWETDERTGEDRKIVVTEVFEKAGVPFTFQVDSGASTNLGANYLWYQAATAVKYGLPREKALEALTILPARLLGVDRYVGSLEVGKEGDVIVLTGDPLEVQTWVETTICRGEVVYERANDAQLQRLLGGQ